MARSGLLLLAGIIGLCACSYKRMEPINSPAPSDSSYLDLTAGWRLRILVPLLKPGQAHATLGPPQTEGNTITLSAENLLGYEVSYYLAQARHEGKVHLQFASAEVSKDGHTSPRQTRPRLPFRLPEKSGFIRLVFLVRVSESDHNMAILSASTKRDLDAFTKGLKQSPESCQITKTVFCVSVPQGIAVRPESPGEPKR